MKRTSTRTLPLGIDVGATRVRIALAQMRSDGRTELVAVATRTRHADVGPSDLGAILVEAVAELRTRERRCVFGVSEPVAIVRSARFPPMRRSDLERAARFEASRAIDYPIEDGDVRVIPLEAGGGEAVIGVVRKDVIAELRSAARIAKLRVLAVDHAAFALRRALPDSGAVLDIGTGGSLLYVFGRGIPRVHRLRVGGAAFTRAIVDALGTDEATAERRKLAHGIAGSGEDLRERLVESVASALVDCRASGYGDTRNVLLVGNGSRLEALAAMLERATNVRVEVAAFAPEVSPVLPPDVLRAAAPDWCQAYGLSLWDAA